MLSTAIGVQFNVNDLDANYEVVGTSDNYSFQYNLGRGSDLVDFEGEAIQKVISLEGNYGLFDVRVFASSDIGVRSEFVESGIAISAPYFEDTFTFANLRIENLPDDANIGALNIYEPQSPGDKLEVQSEYVNRNVEIAWSLLPPGGHVREGEALTTELLTDTFFDKFEITISNGTGSQVIDNNILAASAGMQDTLLTADVTGLLKNYRDFSLTLNDAAFDDILLDRTFDVQIVSHDSFGRTATGLLTGINYEPQAEGLSYALRGSDMSFSWFSNDTDFSGINIKALALPVDESLIYPTDLDQSIEYYQELDSAKPWNLGRGEYRSGDVVYYNDIVYKAKTGIDLDLIESTGRTNTSPVNDQLWNNIGKKVEYYVQDVDVFENTASTYQVWGYSYYYSFQPKDGYGAVDILNLTEEGLVAGGTLRSFTSEVKIGNLRFRERGDDLVFNWDVVDQDGNLVDLEQYRFALESIDVPSILGVSGSLFDSDTENFVTGITEGNTSKISSVDELGNRTVVYDLPNTKVFDTYEFTREINNQIYGTGGFLSNFEFFNTGSGYQVSKEVAERDQKIFTALIDNTGYQPQVGGYNPSIRPIYDTWRSDTTYPQNDVVEYLDDLYVLTSRFGPEADDVRGVFDAESNYQQGDLVIGPDINILPYFEDESYLAGDVVMRGQTIYLALRDQAANAGYFPDQSRSYWRVLSLFNDIPCSIYKCLTSITVDAPFSIYNDGQVGDEYITDSYYYICFEEDEWGRVPMVPFSRAAGTIGDKAIDSDYYYICLGGENWGGAQLLSSSKPNTGTENILDTIIEEHFVHVYTAVGWKKFLVAHWNYNGFVPYADTNNWLRQTPDISTSFNAYISKYSLSVTDWSNQENYDYRNFVLYENDIWSGVQNSGPVYNAPQQPYSGSEYWTSTGVGGVDFAPSYSVGDLVFHNNSVYQASTSNPVGSPIKAVLGAGTEINSDYNSSQWVPFWQHNTTYDGFVYGHVGIPESGKRSVGIEIGIVSNTGEILNSQRLIGINQEPSILANGFQVDSLSETTKVKFDFNYAFSTQEKTSKVNLYRVGAGDVDVLDANGDVIGRDFSKFQITGEDRFPYQSTGVDSTLVKVTLGAADATFGDNITQIIDSPPVPKIDGIDQITGYYYKILPFDDFGSGDLYGVNDNQGDLERVLVYPKNYSNKNPNGLPGPVYRTSRDDVPGPVVDFSGDTSFQNYFLSWIHPSGQIQNLDNIPNDLSHYEVWMSEYDKLELGSLNLFLKDEKDAAIDIDFSNNSGYRRIETDISSTGPIPIERQDPSSGITNATRIFNVSANGAEIETSYLGNTNDTRYFWVRAVDFAGNKSPFTGAPNLTGAEIEGLELTLGQASATDINDFELNMTEIFGNTIALAPASDPFDDSDGGFVNWNDHVLYYQGTGYLISGAGVGQGYLDSEARYIWWSRNDTGVFNSNTYQFDNQNSLGNIYYSGVSYRTSNTHPGGSSGIAPNPEFKDGDFIVAKIAGNYTDGNAVATTVFHAFANALIGTANIAEAAIIDAKINDLRADKITAGEIKGHEIMIGSQAGQYGSILTPGFTGYTNPVDGTQYDATGNGFVLSGDGTFEFRSEQGSLKLDNDGTLSLEGRLRQSDGTPYDFIDLNANPSFFNYNEIEDTGNFRNSVFELESVDPIQIVASFRNSNIQDDEIVFKMRALSTGVGLVDVFSYNDWQNRSDYEISGFIYDHTIAENFEIDGSIRHAKATFEPTGFNAIVDAYEADSIILYCSGQNNNYETTTTITRVIDGKVGVDGVSASYRGDWLGNQGALVGAETITYIGKDSGERNRGDIVKYDNGGSNKYWICRETHTINSSSSFDTSYWNEFGATFTSVATSLFLTEEGYVTEKLAVGNAGVDGLIVSEGFKGGLFDADTKTPRTNPSTEFLSSSHHYKPGGFMLARDSNGNAYFDIGGPVKDSNGNITTYGAYDVVSYIRYNTAKGKIEMRGATVNNTSFEEVQADISALGYSEPTDSLATFIGGGYENEISEYADSDSAGSFYSLGSVIVGGGKNYVRGRFSHICNGFENEIRHNFSTIAGGFQNSIGGTSGWGGGGTSIDAGTNFIGAGKNNSIRGGISQAILAGDNNRIFD